MTSGGDKPVKPNFTGVPLLGQPMPLVVTGLGFPCRVERPLRRTTREHGMVLSVAETPTGPALCVTLAALDGDALTAFLTLDDGSLSAFLDLASRQAERVRDAVIPPAEAVKQ